MILKKYKNNLRPLFTLLALVTMLFGGANMAGAQVQRGKLFDFTDSGRTSFVTLRSPATTGGPITWTIASNPQNPAPGQALIREFVFGSDLLDFIVPEDYTGTGRAEPTVWRDESGTFFVAQTPVGPGPLSIERAVQFGAPDDYPRAMGDYDGDGKADFTVVRQVGDNFRWFMMSSTTGTMRQLTFGSSTGLEPFNDGGFTFLPGADFTGDGRDELIFATTTIDQDRVTYFIGDAVTGALVLVRNFGVYALDVSLPPDDYTGDGRADFVAVRQTDGSTTQLATATWFILNPVTNTFTSTPFGIPDRRFTVNDRPVRGDYDGDGRHDVAVFRPSNQTFYWINSSSPNVIGSQRMPTTGVGVALAALDNY